MPRSISLASVIEKNKIASDVPYLIAVEVFLKDSETKEVLETLRFVNNDEDVTFEGNLFSKGVFDLTYKEEAGGIGSASISVNDYSQIIAQREEEYSGGIGSSVRVLVLNSAQLSETPDVELFYDITGSQSSNWQVTWALGAENALALPFPRFKQRRDRCRFRYKDANCEYSGAIATCDLTLDGPNGCTSHSNEINFGGFPGINNS